MEKKWLISALKEVVEFLKIHLGKKANAMGDILGYLWWQVNKTYFFFPFSHFLFSEM